MPEWTLYAVVSVGLMVAIAIIAWWPLRPPRSAVEELEPFDQLTPREQAEVRRWTRN